MSQTLDPNKVNVSYQASGQGTAKTYPRVDNLAACGGSLGWYYDNEVKPQKVLLCPSLCSNVQADSKAGAWHVVADFGKYVQPTTTGLAPIASLITAGKVKYAEIVVLPELEVGEQAVALNAANYTLDLVSKLKKDDHFKGTKAIVSVTKCNACHDALGTTFHDPGYGGSVTVCRTCHVTTSGGSHLEMQSRGIDSYVHAIHKFQAFDVGDINFADPVFAKRYTVHIEHTFPNFTIKNCEACHNAGTYNPPDQSKSLPGLESRADTYLLDQGWVDATGKPAAGPRNIGDVPMYVVGPTNRACGGCHRAVLINEDNYSELIAFNTHTDNGGYTLDAGKTSQTTTASGVNYIYAMIDRIMSLF
jgi:OmcA/MtrC family decaheme c-type cytochrome